MTTTATELAAAVRRLDPLLTEWLELRRRMSGTPGVQFAIRVDGELVSSGALGLADAERGVPLTPAHRFRIASHSKTFAATSVLMLAARGRLRLDDPVGVHVPALAGTGLADRTVRELIGHQGGVIRDGVDCDYWQLRRDFPDEQTLVDELRQDGVVFGRNEHFKYSNYGYSLVGMVVQAASGRPFNQFVAEEITGPLGLPGITADLPDGTELPDLAAGHSLRLDAADELFVLRNPPTGGMAAATGFVANAVDLSAYAAAHTTGDERLLTDTDKRLMQRVESLVMLEEKELGRYGLGLELHTIGSRHLVGHSGGFPGFVTRTYVDPADRLVVSVLTNASRGPADELAVGVIKLLDLALTHRDHHPERADDAPDLDTFPVSAVTGFGRVTVTRMGDCLVLLHPDQADPTAEAIELEVLGPDRLRLSARPGYGSAGESIDYHRDGDGKIDRIRVGGMTAWPEAAFRARRRERMGRAVASGPELQDVQDVPDLQDAPDLTVPNPTVPV